MASSPNLTHSRPTPRTRLKRIPMSTQTTRMSKVELSEVDKIWPYRQLLSRYWKPLQMSRVSRNRTRKDSQWKDPQKMEFRVKVVEMKMLKNPQVAIDQRSPVSFCSRQKSKAKEKPNPRKPSISPPAKPIAQTFIILSPSICSPKFSLMASSCILVGQTQNLYKQSSPRSIRANVIPQPMPSLPAIVVAPSQATTSGTDMHRHQQARKLSRQTRNWWTGKEFESDSNSSVRMRVFRVGDISCSCCQIQLSAYWIKASWIVWGAVLRLFCNLDGSIFLKWPMLIFSLASTSLTQLMPTTRNTMPIATPTMPMARKGTISDRRSPMLQLTMSTGMVTLTTQKLIAGPVPASFFSLSARQSITKLAARDRGVTYYRLYWNLYDISTTRMGQRVQIVDRPMRLLRQHRKGIRKIERTVWGLMWVTGRCWHSPCSQVQSTGQLLSIVHSMFYSQYLILIYLSFLPSIELCIIIITVKAMQFQKIKAAFQRKGYTPNAYIDKREYQRVLDSLVVGGEFHEEVADELWTQAAGERPSKELRVSDICTTIVDAQNILRTRIQETNEEINALETEKRRLQANTSKESIRRIEEIDSRLDELYGEKESFQDDYRLVTEPFGIQLLASTLKVGTGNLGNSAAQPPPDLYQPTFQPEPYQKSDHVESDDLKYIFYLTLAFGFVEIIMIYGKSDFLNLIVLTCLLSIYLMNFFDRVYIRLTLALIVVSIALDVVWLILYAGTKWNPATVSNSSIYQLGYFRFIVFFTVALIPLKIAIFFFLFKHRNADTQDKYLVSLGLMKIMLSANKSNPISKGLANTAVLSQ